MPSDRRRAYVCINVGRDTSEEVSAWVEYGNPPEALTPQGSMAAMTAFISHTTIDCTDAYQLSEWWKKVLGYVDLPDDPNNPGDEECPILHPETGHQLLFIEVPDFDVSTPKRIHLDLRPTEASRDEELQTLLELGATQVADHRGIHGPGTGWVVLADPEGNQFCILRAKHELVAES